MQLVRVEPAAYRVFFEGGTQLDLLYDVTRMMEQLESLECGAGESLTALQSSNHIETWP